LVKKVANIGGGGLRPAPKGLTFCKFPEKKKGKGGSYKWGGKKRWFVLSLRVVGGKKKRAGLNGP